MHRVVARHCQYGGIDGIFRKSEQAYDTSTGNNSELYNDYTFKVLEFENMFSDSFIDKCAQEIRDMISIPEEDKSIEEVK